MVFYNGTVEDFHVTWGKVPYTFKAGQVYEKIAISDNGMESVQLTDAVCSVFAHHLAMKVLNTPSLDANSRRNKEGEYVGNFDRQVLSYNMGNVEQLKSRFTHEPSEDIAIPERLAELPAFTGEAPEAPEEPETVVEAPKAKKKPGRKPKAKADIEEPVM